MNESARKNLKKWALFSIRWGIAVVGVWFVLSKITWYDQVLALITPSNIPVAVTLAAPADDDSASFQVIDHGAARAIPREQVVNEPDAKSVIVDGSPRKLLGLDLIGPEGEKTVARFLVMSADGASGQWVTPDHVKQGPGGYQLAVPHPRVITGVVTMTRQAQPSLLWASIFVFPVTFVITAIRWHALLKVLDVHLTVARTFVLNMVGAFYNTFMPGSTGGDLFKAFYVARQTHHRTRAVMSVLVDRIVGLLALIILGGVMATAQWKTPECRSVAIGSALICFCVAASLTIFYNKTLSRLFLLDALIKRLPMQKQVKNAIETMHIYGRRPVLLAVALLVSFPVHMVVVLSAMLAGMAFHLPIPLWYYWTVVPVVVLSGAIPISPQGAGVMEAFALLLTHPLGVTVAQAVALTMSIRLVQILWNLTGGIFVLTDNFHLPTPAEEKKIEEEDQDEPPQKAATQVPAV
jgi:uncharacterized protein (TIRG00374 family)